METMPLPRPEKLEDAILVTHKGCMDGAGCAIMFCGAGGKRENVKFVAAGMVEKFIKSDPIFQSDKFLIFADIGVNDTPETRKYADVLEKRGNLVLLDHHNTSLHMVGREWAVIEEKNERCGTRMLRDYLIEQFPWHNQIQAGSWRRFAELLDDHDRWLRQQPMSEDMATFMSFVGQESFITRFADPKQRACDNIAKGRMSHGFFTEFEDDLLGILKKRRDEAIEDALKKSFVRQVKLPDGGEVTMAVVITMEPNISLLLQRLLEKCPEAQVAASVSLEKGAVSLRSRGGVPDCSHMASLFGGGGHKGAAGHKIPQDIVDVIMEHIYG